jgi:hypothetical protein
LDDSGLVSKSPGFVFSVMTDTPSQHGLFVKNGGDAYKEICTDCRNHLSENEGKHDTTPHLPECGQSRGGDIEPVWCRLAHASGGNLPGSTPALISVFVGEQRYSQPIQILKLCGLVFLPPSSK